jgi:hypothetical protein
VILGGFFQGFQSDFGEVYSFYLGFLASCLQKSRFFFVELGKFRPSLRDTYPKRS